MPEITEMFAFVASEPNDPTDEGVIAFKTREGWMPAVAADRARLESIRPVIADIMGGLPYRLVRFGSVEIVEEFN